MKKLFILATAILAGMSVSAQSNVGRDVNYYGVDFSKAKTFGASETGDEFKEVFGSINSLVIGEWAKYNPGKFLRKNIVVRDISATRALNDKIDPSEIAVTSSGYFLTEGDIAGMVKKYEIAQTEGTGLVFIGELLDKSTTMGTFAVVCFDIASREVLFCKMAAGEAKGFGLRNYWARSLYNVLLYF